MKKFILISAVFLTAAFTACQRGGLWNGSRASIDSIPPALVSHTPAAPATLLSVSVPVVLTFSENVDAASVTSSTFVVTQDGIPVTGSISVSGRQPLLLLRR